MTGEASILVVCACGKRLKAPFTAAGKKARCKACGATLRIPADGSSRVPVTAVAGQPIARVPQNASMAAGVRPAPMPTTPVIAAPMPASFDSDEDGGMDALFELARQASSAPAPLRVARCPQCRSPLDEGAVLCTDCGYDTRTGKALATKAASKPAAPVRKAGKQPVDRMAPTGSFMAGFAMSAAFAAAASLVWIGFAWATGYSLSLVAILIGGCAGAGMRFGHRGFSSGGATAAACVTLLTILLAKLAVIELLIMPVILRHHPNATLFSLKPAALAYYFCSPIGLIIMIVGMGAAYRAANGSITD